MAYLEYSYTEAARGPGNLVMVGWDMDRPITKESFIARVNQRMAERGETPATWYLPRDCAQELADDLVSGFKRDYTLMGINADEIVHCMETAGYCMCGVRVRVQDIPITELGSGLGDADGKGDPVPSAYLPLPGKFVDARIEALKSDLARARQQIASLTAEIERKDKCIRDLSDHVFKLINRILALKTGGAESHPSKVADAAIDDAFQIIKVTTNSQNWRHPKSIVPDPVIVNSLGSAIGWFGTESRAEYKPAVVANLGVGYPDRSPAAVTFVDPYKNALVTENPAGSALPAGASAAAAKDEAVPLPTHSKPLPLRAMR